MPNSENTDDEMSDKENLFIDESASDSSEEWYSSDASEEGEIDSTTFHWTPFKDADDENYLGYLSLLYNYLSDAPIDLQAIKHLLASCPSLMQYINAPIPTADMPEGYVKLPTNAPLLVIMVAKLNEEAVEWLLQHNAVQSPGFFPKVIDELYKVMINQLQELEIEMAKLKGGKGKKSGDPMLDAMQSSNFLFGYLLFQIQRDLDVLQKISIKLAKQLDEKINLKTTKPSSLSREHEMQKCFMRSIKRPLSMFLPQETQKVAVKKIKYT